MALPRCKRCHRVLKDPESIASGLAPHAEENSMGKKKSRAASRSSKVSARRRPGSGETRTP